MRSKHKRLLRSAIRFVTPILLTFLQLGSIDAQQVVNPEVRERLDAGFATAFPQPGDYLPNIAFSRLPGNKPFNLRYDERHELKLIVTASLTCPKTRRHLPALEKLIEKYHERLGVVFVYVVEAHPEIDVCPYLGVVDVTEANIRDDILYRQPKTLNDRLAIASEFHQRYPIGGTVLVDSMDNIAWRVFGQSPNMALLADDKNRIFYRQGWLEPETLEQQIITYLSALEKRHSQDINELDESVPSNPELTEILKRLDPDHPIQGDFVRWLEKADRAKLKLLFQRYPTVVNERLTYGAHDHLESTILQIMIQRHDLELVRIACEAGASVDLETKSDTPLSCALFANHVPIVRYLIAQGADVQTCPPHFEFSNLLRFAAWHGNNELAQCLVDAGLNHDIFTYCGLGMVDAVDAQLDAIPSSGLRFDAAGNLPLAYAVAGNQPAVVRLLLDRKMAVDVKPYRQTSPMELAVVAKDTTMLDMLLQNGFSPDSGFGRALFLSLKADKYDHFRLLMDAGVKLDIREKGMLPLHLVIDRNLPRQFSDDLIQAGADINALTAGYADDGCGPEDPQSSEETPLHIAARRLCPEIVPLLLSRNAMSSQLDQSKLTPLAAAVLSTLMAPEKDVAQGLATIKALIEGGCPKDIVDSNGQPIIKAIGKVQRERVTEDPEIAKARPAYANPPFVLEPRSYLGPHGFDATRLTIRPLLQEIMRIWDTCP